MTEPRQPHIDVHESGLLAEHDMPCAVCHTKSAVLELGRGRFSPCWECQREGWSLVQFPRWLAFVERWLDERGRMNGA